MEAAGVGVTFNSSMGSGRAVSCISATGNSSRYPDSILFHTCQRSRVGRTEHECQRCEMQASIHQLRGCDASDT
jgi:hypothetical protein